MSGDVQPRKRKDKKKKKDDLGIEDPRGTAAALGEGDVFIHSQHDHGTGGHWCAKIIFFSLLAVLITLIGLIILENRGLTDLEANAVESRYSGVLEGWLEDTPDHHDEHTLELKHHDNEDEDHNIEATEEEDQDDESHEDDTEAEEDEDSENVESNEDDDHEDDDEEEDDEHANDDDDEEHNDESEENLDEDDDNEGEEIVSYNRYNYNEDDDDDGKNDNDDNDDVHSDDDSDDQSDEDNDHYELDGTSREFENKEEDKLSNELIDNIEYEDDESNEQENYNKHFSDEQDNEDEDEHDEDTQEDDDEEIEKIEKEIIDDDDSEEIVAPSKVIEDDVDEGESQEADDDQENDMSDTDDDDDEPPLERIAAPPAGKPFIEIEEETIEKPINTLADEEEYERRQEELRKEEEAQGTQLWLRLAVGGALLVATHAVLRRATARGDVPEPEEEDAREETPPVDRRMTLVAEQPVPRVVQESPVISAPRKVEEEVFKKPAPVSQSVPIVKKDNEEELKIKKAVVEEKVLKVDEEKELYSDEDEMEDEEEEEEEEEEDIKEPVKEIIQKKAIPVAEQKTEEESEPEDVEIIEEEEEEEEISDVDDADLLTRLEAKYGRLPEPERPGQKHKGGEKSIEDDWPGEPSDPYWRAQLDNAEEELRQGAWASCEKRVNVASLANSGRARWLAARAMDLSAEAKRDNNLLSRAITAYLHLLKMHERLPDKKLLEVAHRTIDRIQFRGVYLNAEPVYRLLIRRFPNDVNYRNNLTISFLMANRADLADEVLKETLRIWPNDRIALAHHGFVLKNQHNKLEDAVKALYKALEGDTGPANEPRFYYHLGDALMLLGRLEEAHEVHKRGAALGHFLSPSQRSLYNVPRLKSRPWWVIEETPYVKLALALERSWRDILKEGEAAKALYEKEKEGLKERGEWSQLDMFVRGAEIPGRCVRAPVTCALVRAEAAAAGCRRGQVKFSAMEAGTHVRPHVGPTNCRLRMHLGLSNTKNTFIRVDKETRQWQTGKTLLFDDSFEHEVWHNGSGSRLVLIVDVWHPDLSAAERRTLPAI